MHATTMKTKRHYTAPVTQRATVELEGGFCGSIDTKYNETVKAAQHETGYDQSWDSDFGDQVGDNTNVLVWD